MKYNSWIGVVIVLLSVVSLAQGFSRPYNQQSVSPVPSQVLNKDGEGRIVCYGNDDCPGLNNNCFNLFPDYDFSFPYYYYAGQCAVSTCFPVSCTVPTDCCFNMKCNNPTPLSSGYCVTGRAEGDGCFTGQAQVRLQNGSYIQTQDLQLGDVIVTPDGLADVIAFSTEQFYKANLYTFNGETPFFTSLHLFPPSSPTGQLNLSRFLVADPFNLYGYASWMKGVTSQLENNLQIGKINNYNPDATAKNTVTAASIENYQTQTDFTGPVYSYVAWPRNSPTRVPTLYMMGNDYVTYSYVQADLIVAAASLLPFELEGYLQDFLVNVPSGVNPVCWGTNLGLLHGKWMAQDLVNAYTAITGNPPPTAPPQGYDGPASEWIEAVHQLLLSYYRQDTDSSTKEQSETSSTEKTQALDAVILGYYIINFDIAGVENVIWLNWISYSTSVQVIQAALYQFLQQHKAYDYSQVDASCELGASQSHIGKRALLKHVVKKMILPHGKIF